MQVVSATEKYWLHLVLLLFLESSYIIQLMSYSFLPITHQLFHSYKSPLRPRMHLTFLSLGG